MNFGHNFGTRNARKSIRESKDSYYSLAGAQPGGGAFGALDDSLDFKQSLSQKNGSLG